MQLGGAGLCRWYCFFCMCGLYGRCLSHGTVLHCSTNRGTTAIIILDWGGSGRERYALCTIPPVYSCYFTVYGSVEVGLANFFVFYCCTARGTAGTVNTVIKGTVHTMLHEKGVIILLQYILYSQLYKGRKEGRKVDVYEGAIME